MARKTARVAALQLLYEYEFNADGEDTLSLIDPQGLTDADYAYIDRTVSGVSAGLDSIDPVLAKYAVGWAVDRMSRVDKSILRLAVYEILFSDVPGSAAVSEAVELAHLFSSDEAAPFINGVLGAFLRDTERERGQR